MIELIKQGKITYLEAMLKIRERVKKQEPRKEIKLFPDNYPSVNGRTIRKQRFDNRMDWINK